VYNISGYLKPDRLLVKFEEGVKKWSYLKEEKTGFNKILYFMFQWCFVVLSQSNRFHTTT